MSLTIGFWDGLSAKSRMGGFFYSQVPKSLKLKITVVFE
jgi:hypothetical protein